MISMAPMEMCDHDVVEDMYKAVYILEETASRSSGRPIFDCRERWYKEARKSYEVDGYWIGV